MIILKPKGGLISESLSLFLLQKKVQNPFPEYYPTKENMLRLSDLAIFCFEESSQSKKLLEPPIVF